MLQNADGLFTKSSVTTIVRKGGNKFFQRKLFQAPS